MSQLPLPTDPLSRLFSEDAEPDGSPAHVQTRTFYGIRQKFPLKWDEADLSDHPRRNVLQPNSVPQPATSQLVAPRSDLSRLQAAPIRPEQLPALQDKGEGPRITAQLPRATNPTTAHNRVTSAGETVSERIAAPTAHSEATSAGETISERIAAHSDATSAGETVSERIAAPTAHSEATSAGETISERMTAPTAHNEAIPVPKRAPTRATAPDSGAILDRFPITAAWFSGALVGVIAHSLARGDVWKTGPLQEAAGPHVIWLRPGAPREFQVAAWLVVPTTSVLKP
jgi:hypothetical protein